jgi:hypothetical protein
MPGDLGRGPFGFGGSDAATRVPAAAAKLVVAAMVMSARTREPREPREPMYMKLRQRLTYANVMSTVAVFIALGGSSYAAFTISGRDIRNRSIPAKKIKRNSITGKEVREARLNVPWARNARRLGGLTAAELRIRCPDDTFPIADVCVEREPHAASAYGGAVLECLRVGTPASPGRRLPTHGELMAALTAVRLAPGGELTSSVYPSSRAPGQLDVLYVTDQVGSVGLTPDTFDGGKAYRCVTDPLN